MREQGGRRAERAIGPARAAERLGAVDFIRRQGEQGPGSSPVGPAPHPDRPVPHPEDAQREDLVGMTREGMAMPLEGEELDRAEGGLGPFQGNAVGHRAPGSLPQVGTSPTPGGGATFRV